MVMHVVDVMTEKPAVVQSDLNVLQAAQLMTQLDTDSLVVLAGDKPAGIVTEKDFIQKVLSKEADPKKTQLADIMSSPLITVQPDADLAEAAALMNKYRIRRLPVVDRGTIVGLITSRELVKNLSSYISKLFSEYFYA